MRFPFKDRVTLRVNLRTGLWSDLWADLWVRCRDEVRRVWGSQPVRAARRGFALIAMTAALVFLFLFSHIFRAVALGFDLWRRLLDDVATARFGFPIGRSGAAVALGVVVTALALPMLWASGAIFDHRQDRTELAQMPHKAMVPAPEPKVPGSKVPGSKVPGSKVPEANISEQKIPEPEASRPEPAAASVSVATPGEGGGEAAAGSRADHEKPSQEENAAVAAQGVSVFATLGEAILHEVGESLGFFEIGAKVNEVFIPLKNGDTSTAMSKGAGAATEYGLAAYLVDAFEIMGMIASGVMVETVAGIAGSMAIVRTSVMAGDKVEETTHRSLTKEQPAPQ